MRHWLDVNCGISSDERGASEEKTTIYAKYLLKNV